MKIRMLSRKTRIRAQLAHVPIHTPPRAIPYNATKRSSRRFDQTPEVKRVRHMHAQPSVRLLFSKSARKKIHQPRALALICMQESAPVCVCGVVYVQREKKEARAGAAKG